MNPLDFLRPIDTHLKEAIGYSLNICDEDYILLPMSFPNVISGKHEAWNFEISLGEPPVKVTTNDGLLNRYEERVSRTSATSLQYGAISKDIEEVCQ